MSPEKKKSEIKLRPDAPAFVPPSKVVSNSLLLQTNTVENEPQCSRYSRKSVRRIDDSPNSPRPILGSNFSHPRPILGRKENVSTTDEDNVENYIGKEFRSIYRRMQRMKISEENKKQKKKTKS